MTMSGGGSTRPTTNRRPPTADRWRQFPRHPARGPADRSVYPPHPDRARGGARGGDGARVWLKLECQQRTGSFKLRGALNRLLTLPEAARARGVLTCSAGNHGLGVAEASRLTRDRGDGCRAG